MGLFDIFKKKEIKERKNGLLKQIRDFSEKIQTVR